MSGRRVGRPSVGPVNPTSRTYGSTGSSTPTERAIAVDHTPAAQTTVEVSTAPSDVSTALTSVPSSVTPVTAQPVTTVAPWLRAPAAYPCATASGLAWPSSGQYVAASTPSRPAIGHSSRISPGSTKRLGTPSSFWSATLDSNAATSSARSRRKRYPTWWRSISAPGRSANRVNASMLRRPIAMLSGSEN